MDKRTGIPGAVTTAALVLVSASPINVPTAASAAGGSSAGVAVTPAGPWLGATPADLGTLGGANSTAAVERTTSARALIGWGPNAFEGARHDVPRRLETRRVVRLAVGSDHNLAVTRNGTLVAWGDSGHGKSDVPAVLKGVRVISIAAGGEHSLAVTETGRVLAWGANRRGQSDVPADLRGLRVVQVAAGSSHSLALTEGGSVRAWGANRQGQSDVPAALEGVRVVQVDAGSEHSLALTADGEVVAWGASNSGQGDVPPALQGVRVTRVAAGGRHNLALTEDGAVVAWGANGHGQCDVPRSLDGAAVSQIAAGDLHSLALTAQGRLVAWGGPANGSTALPAVLRGVRVSRVAAGGRHSLAVAGYLGPDVQISGSVSRPGPFAGNNYFVPRGNLADLGGQWTHFVGFVAQAHTFTVRVYNDTRTAHKFRIRGSSARVLSPGRPRWDPSKVRYYDGDTLVTAAMRSPRGIVVRIKAGEFRQYKVWVALVPRFALEKRTSAVVSAVQVGRPRRSDRARATTLFSD
jgi:hypothetical protein